MSPPSASVIGAVLADGPFVEVGSPTAVAVSNDLVVVAGSLGWPLWNGRSVMARSDHSVGWYPVATYRRADLRCRSFLTSTWEANAVAIHPAGDLIAVGTGSYDGGYMFEGELLLHHIATGETVSVLSSERCVESVAWADDHTLQIIVAPRDDEDITNEDELKYESYVLDPPSWHAAAQRSINFDDFVATVVPAPRQARAGAQATAAELHSTLAGLASAVGASWAVRRQAWAIDAESSEIVLGVEGGVESWSIRAGSLNWRAEMDGTCTQLLRGRGRDLTAGLWELPGQTFHERPLVAVRVAATGEPTDLLRPGFPAVLVPRADGGILVRSTEPRPAEQTNALVLSPDGDVVGHVDLGPYDLFNHHFEVRGAPEFLVLIGRQPQTSRDKWVASVERTWNRRWQVKRLFPLAWTPGAHLFGGPGVWADDEDGTAVIHTGAVHDPRGLLAGNAFVLRRHYPSGEVQWHVPLDNTVTAIAACGASIVVVTNHSELHLIDAGSGKVRASWTVQVDGRPVVPLSLDIAPTGRAWIGTLDGRAIEVDLDVRAG